jgi:CDGSH-type Zn-finger protein
LNIQWLADIVEAVPGCYSEFVEREDSLPSTKVTIFNNGPLRIEGDFEIVDQEGKAFGLGGRTAVSLCRCGHSSNSPFCDGTHKRQSFTSAVTARDLPGPPKP